jgi:hypothetical protein
MGSHCVPEYYVACSTLELLWTWWWSRVDWNMLSYWIYKRHPCNRDLMLLCLTVHKQNWLSNTMVWKILKLNKCNCVSNVWHFLTTGLSLHRDNTLHRSSDNINSFLNMVFWKTEQHGKYSFSSVWKILYSLEGCSYVTVKYEDMIFNPITTSTWTAVTSPTVLIPLAPQTLHNKWEHARLFFLSTSLFEAGRNCSFSSISSCSVQRLSRGLPPNKIL